VLEFSAVGLAIPLPADEEEDIEEDLRTKQQERKKLEEILARMESVGLH
jgi:hypothetical protein